VTIYDPLQSYAQGNGALCECIKVVATGTTAATVLLLFYRMLEDTNPLWRFASELAIPAIASVPTTTTIAGFPLFLPLPNILFPLPMVGTTANFTGLRVNSTNRKIQWGVALTVSTGAAFPLIVTMYGGEY
jgi:hypothetical protein